MTYDTDEYNEHIKITSTIRNELGDSCKEFFAKGLSALLADEHFLLLYVPENGAKMKVIRPASDSEHRKRVIKRINEAKGVPSFYYALSHLWGISKDNRHLWNEIGEYVDDETGRPMEPVSMRPEKRDKLLAMLRDHPDSYWWIDVLCARTDTPLDIMGDIYACCLQCIAMIDCDPTLIPEINIIQAQGNLYEFCRKIQSECPTYEQVSEKKGPQLLFLLCKFIQSRWWQRVWTWQEIILPFGDVRFMAEAGIYQPEGSTITVKEIVEYMHLANHISRFQTKEDEESLALKSAADKVFEVIYHIFDARRFFKDRRGKATMDFYSLFLALRYSSRQCMDPVDYVYGVLGILQINIPRMKDPNQVWERFLYEIEKPRHVYDPQPFSLDCGHEFDLRKADTIGEVYQEVLRIFYSPDK